MAHDHLHVLMDNQVIGELRRTSGKRGGWALTYFDNAATPLSIALPIAAGSFSVRVTQKWLEGLLPDNAAVLDTWAQSFGESRDNRCDLLRHVGEDVAGAVQFVRDDRLKRIQSGELDSLVMLSKSDIEARLAAMRDHRADWHFPGNSGQFSLAGAQTKTALLYDATRSCWQGRS